MSSTTSTSEVDRWGVGDLDTSSASSLDGVGATVEDAVEKKLQEAIARRAVQAAADADDAASSPGTDNVLAGINVVPRNPRSSRGPPIDGDDRDDDNRGDGNHDDHVDARPAGGSAGPARDTSLRRMASSTAGPPVFEQRTPQPDDPPKRMTRRERKASEAAAAAAAAEIAIAETTPAVGAVETVEQASGEQTKQTSGEQASAGGPRVELVTPIDAAAAPPPSERQAPARAPSAPTSRGKSAARESQGSSAARRRSSRAGSAASGAGAASTTGATEVAAGSRRDGAVPIEDALLEAGRALEERRERRRREAEEKEMKQVTGTPNLSKTAQSIQRASDLPVEDRLYRYKQERDTRLAEEAERLQREEDTRNAYTPKINRHSKEIAESYAASQPDVAARLQRWSREREARLVEMRERAESEAVAEMRDPVIGERTKRIVRSQRDNDMPVEERLLAEGRLARERRALALEELNREREDRSMPPSAYARGEVATAAERAAREADADAGDSDGGGGGGGGGGGPGRRRDGDDDGSVDVFTRLHESERARREKIEAARRDQEERLERTISMANRSHRNPFTPGRASEDPGREDPIAREAILLGREARRKREKKYAQLLAARSKTSGGPPPTADLNPSVSMGGAAGTSRILADVAVGAYGGGGGGAGDRSDAQALGSSSQSRAGYGGGGGSFVTKRSEKIAARLPTTAEDRLYGSASLTAARYAAMSDGDAAVPEELRAADESRRECTFHPTISERTNEIYSRMTGGRKVSFEARMAEMARKSAIYERRREQLRREREEKELSECTFKPRIPPASIALTESSTSGKGDVAERSVAWDRARRERLEEARREVEESALQECTFAPRVNTAVPPEIAAAAEARRRGSADDSGPSEELVSKKGFDTFVERQRAAREAREARARFFERKGTRWERRTTAPQEFKFNQPQRVASVKKVQPKRLRSYRDGLAALSAAASSSAAGSDFGGPGAGVSPSVSFAGPSAASSASVGGGGGGGGRGRDSIAQEIDFGGAVFAAENTPAAAAPNRRSRQSVARPGTAPASASLLDSPQSVAGSSPGGPKGVSTPADAERQRRIERFARLRDVLKQRNLESPESQLSHSSRALRAEEEDCADADETF